MVSLTVSERHARIAVVTAGLSLAGGVVGGICSAAAVTLIGGIESGVGALVSQELASLVGIAAGFGAVAGMIGAPVLSWAVLRRVPLGRAALFTAIGTVAGAVSGELAQPLNPYATTIPGVLIGALCGFIGAGVLARIRTSSQPATISAKPKNEG